MAAKKGRTAYFIFMADARPAVAAEHPGAPSNSSRQHPRRCVPCPRFRVLPRSCAAAEVRKIADVSRLIAERWKALTPEEREVRRRMGPLLQEQQHLEPPRVILGRRVCALRARICAPRASALSALRAKVYERRAADEKTAFAAATAAAPPEADDAAGAMDGAAGDGADDGKTALPLSRVRKIAKLDPDTGNVGGQAALALALATEMFVELLAEEAAAVAMVRGRRCSGVQWCVGTHQCTVQVSP